MYIYNDIYKQVRTQAMTNYEVHALSKPIDTTVLRFINIYIQTRYCKKCMYWTNECDYSERIETLILSKYETQHL